MLNFLEYGRRSLGLALALGLSTRLSTRQLPYYCFLTEKPWKPKSQTSEWVPTQRGSRSWAEIGGLASQTCKPLFSFLALLLSMLHLPPTDTRTHTHGAR